jgi:hypothetical protein
MPSSCKSEKLSAIGITQRLLAIPVIGVLGVCLTLSHDAFAQEPKKPVPAQQAKKSASPPIAPEDSDFYVVEKVRDEEKKVTDQIAQKSANVAALSTSVSQAEQRQSDVDHQARIFNDSPESQKLSQDAADHDAACAGKALQRAEYDRCQSWKGSIDTRVDQHNATFAEFRRRYDAEGDEIGTKTNELVLEKAGMTKLQNYLSWLRASEKALVKDCQNVPDNATIEELKHRCGNVQFDGARVDLPACETERCKDWNWASFGKPQRTPEQAIQDYKSSGKANPTPNPLLDKTPVPPPSK